MSSGGSCRCRPSSASATSSRSSGSLRDDPPLHPAAAEVDRLFWEPLADLLVEGTYREERWGTPPLDRPIYFFELDDETVWGATARMLHQLLRVAHGIVGPEPEAI